MRGEIVYQRTHVDRGGTKFITHAQQEARDNIITALKPYLQHLNSYCRVVRCDRGLDAILNAVEETP